MARNHLLYFELGRLTHSLLFGLNKIYLLVEGNLWVLSRMKSCQLVMGNVMESRADSVLPLLMRASGLSFVEGIEGNQSYSVSFVQERLGHPLCHRG